MSESDEELRADNDSLRRAGGKLEELASRLQDELSETERALAKCESENERLWAALTEITDLDLEGGEASLADAIVIADEALNPPPTIAKPTFE